MTAGVKVEANDAIHHSAINRKRWGTRGSGEMATTPVQHFQGKSSLNEVSVLKAQHKFDPYLATNMSVPLF